MLRTMVTATNTMSQLQSQMDIIGNNLANSNTHGYKAKDVKFQELLYQQFNNDKLDKVDRQSPVGIRYGVGASLAQASMNWKQGSLQSTGRDLDFAFQEPKQYFNVLMPDGENGQQTAYTRQGAFYVSPMENGNLMLVTGDGYPVADAAGQAITIPDNVSSFSVNESGVLTANYPDGSTVQRELAVSVLQKPQLMEQLSETYIALPNNLAELGVNAQDVIIDLQGAERGEIALTNQVLEMSNVDMSKEMTELMTAQRSYQFSARSISIADQMLGLINGIR
ncbi:MULTISPECIES: flagellar hook-basal body protein [Bacillaceae]|uniref:flagellar hook-basal body protein n=1 Tax=Bacillaceae TaxID=186817 RepID=UPI0006F1D5C9|nr:MULTISPECIES: flagellar hook-basal body protein [Bacillaceae]KQL36945.1 flagellar hook-basal body protein [Psychrobacillus sp. FJAT-21963]MDF2068124.1 flagellar hook-basal body protein [Bacillus sp. Cr_A10]